MLRCSKLSNCYLFTFIHSSWLKSRLRPGWQRRVLCYFHSLTHSLIHSFTHTHSFIHSCHSFTQPFTHSFIHLNIHSFFLYIYSFIRLFVRLFVRSFIHPFIHSFIHSFIQSAIFVCTLTLFVYYVSFSFQYFVRCCWFTLCSVCCMCTLQ